MELGCHHSLYSGLSAGATQNTPTPLGVARLASAAFHLIASRASTGIRHDILSFLLLFNHSKNM